MKQYQFEVKGIDCADCAAKLEGKIAKIEGITNVSLSFMHEKLTYECDEEKAEAIETEMRKIVAVEEPDATVKEKGKHHTEDAHEHHHEHCECCHEHHTEGAHEGHTGGAHEGHHDGDHEEEMATYIFEVKDMDCANCAARVEGKIKELAGISNVSLSFMNNKLIYDCAHDEGSKMKDKVIALIHDEEPDWKVTFKGHKHHHTDDSHEHNHEHHTEGAHEGHTGGAHEGHHDGDHGEETATYIFEVKDIDCADCAAKVEEKIKKIEGISNVSLSFMNNKLTYDCDHDEGDRIKEEVIALINKEEPDAKVTFKGHKHHGGHESHHEDHDETPVKLTAHSKKYSVTGIDCADCAAKIEGKIKKLDGISNVSLSFMNSTLVFDADEADRSRLETEIKDLLAKEEPDAVFAPMAEATTTKVEDDEDEEAKKMLIRLGVGAIMFVVGLFLSGTPMIIVMLATYLILGYDVLLKAVKGIGRGQVFDEHFLMAIATIAAIYLGDFKEAAGVMLFYQIGEFFQDMAVAKSRKSIGTLMDIRPESATVYRNGGWAVVDPEDVEIGETIRVKPGEKVPLDGVVLKGASSLDTSSLTGESKPRDVDINDAVISGSVNETGVLEIKVTKEYGESTVAKILELVENNDSRKASAENFITKFSRYYTPIVVFSAVAVAIIVSLLGYGINTGIERACTFLVISCPCALVISIPLSFFAGIGGLSSRGVLVKGANLIETLAKVENVVMDKTGTLTTGTFKVEDVKTASVEKEVVLEDAAYAEYFSNHPIANGIKDSYGKNIDANTLSDVQEIAGRGLKVKHGNDTILAGNYKMMEEEHISCEMIQDSGTLVYVAKNGVYEGCLILRDQLKEDAVSAIQELHKAGKKCYIVSGDAKSITDMVKGQLGVDDAYGECMPEDKVNKVKEFKEKGITAFVGDGVNDAPVLTVADTGIAMGALGSDAAIEAADVVIMDDKPSKISLAITSSKRILRIANENIYGAIIIKVLTLIFGAFGIANMWWAIFADTGVAMLCVMNSMRLLHIARKS